MNPLDWEAFQRLQGSLDSNHQTVVNNSAGSVSRANNDTYCQNSRYTVDDRQSNVGVHLGLKGPPSQNFYIEQSEVEDPDGEPYEIEETEKDPELKRKWNELREIEEKIMHKKVAIALKKVETFAKDSRPPSLSHNEQSAMCKGATLKDRVNVILQQRHSVSFLSKVQSPKYRMNSSSLSKDGLLQEDHPLKIRVKALMKQRCSGPCVLPANKEVPDATRTPPSHSLTSSAESSVNQGFQRFLNVLNKGVDMDLLSRIVNDDSEDLPVGQELLDVHSPAVDNKSELPFRSENKQSNSGVLPLDHSWSDSEERETNPPRQETSLNDHLPDDDDDEKNDSGHICFGSSSRSRSPPAVKKKKKEVEEEKPKVDEQHVQLQNILNSLGLSMEVEEMSKLADRTQERLYGKKCGGIKSESRGKQEGKQRGFHRQDRKSSSSSSSSSSSRSTSRSCSPSPSCHRHSHSRDLKQRRTSEHSSSRDRSRDGLTGQDGEEAQKYGDGDKDGKDSKETSPYQHLYPQNQTYPHADPAAFPNYSFPQYSQYNEYHSDSYSAVSNSYWTYTHDAIPPSLYPSGHSLPQNTDHHFLLNPDLSKSEGQIGSTSRPRCLQVITTKPALQLYLKELTKAQRKKRNNVKRNLRRRRKKMQQNSTQPANPSTS